MQSKSDIIYHVQPWKYFASHKSRPLFTLYLDFFVCSIRKKVCDKLEIRWINPAILSSTTRPTQPTLQLASFLDLSHRF